MRNLSYFSLAISIFELIFCVVPHMTPGKVYRYSKLQKFVSKLFYFYLKFFFISQTNIMKSVKFSYFCFILYTEKMLTVRATIKSWNGRVETLVYIYIKKVLVIIFSPYFIILFSKKMKYLLLIEWSTLSVYCWVLEGK